MFFDKTENCTLSVEGMHCNHCKAKVENTLKALKGVKKAEADLNKSTATISYVPNKVTPDELAKAVNEAGFKATVK